MGSPSWWDRASRSHVSSSPSWTSIRAAMPSERNCPRSRGAGTCASLLDRILIRYAILSSELEDDLDLLVRSEPDLLVPLGSERHDRLADRPLDPEAPVTTRDGDLDPSPLA